MKAQQVKHIVLIGLILIVVPTILLVLFRKRIFGFFLKPEQKKYIDQLHKKAQFKLSKFIDRVEKETDYNIIITDGYRTFADQQKEHEIDPRNPAAGDGYHDYGLACYDEETEVLSENGWKYFKDLDRNENVMVFKNDNLFYERPISHIEYAYEGEMIHVKTRSVDLLTTPNHKFVIKNMHCPRNGKTKRYRIWDKNWSFEFAENIREKHRIPTSGKYIGPFKIEYPFSNKCNPETWWEFMGFYLSEGSSCGVSDGIKRKHGQRYAVKISQSKNGKAYEKIKKCLDGLGLHYNYRGHNFIIHSKLLWQILFPLGNSYQKRISRYLLDAPHKLLQILFDSMILGDGSTYSTHFAYFTVNKKLADDFSELSIKLGRSCIINKRDPRYGQILPQGTPLKTFNNQYTVYSRTGKFQDLRNGDGSKKNINKIYYNGMVYCVETNAGAVVVRRNNRVSICGNCDINATNGTSYLRKASSKEAWEATGIPNIARDMGIRWGGDFKTYYDPVHFDLGNDYDVKHLKELAFEQFGTNWNDIKGNEIKLT